MTPKDSFEPVDGAGGELAALHGGCHKADTSSGDEDTAGCLGSRGGSPLSDQSPPAISAARQPEPSSERDDQPQLWPELMAVKTAARYADEPSPKAFRRRVGKVYPKPIRIAGRGDVWRKRDLDACITALRGPSAAFNDLADVL